VSYVIAAYAVVVGSVVAYALVLARARRRLARELTSRPARNDG